MKIASINNNSSQLYETNKKSKPSFKSSIGMGALGISGALMQGIEKQGYFLSFLIQDGLGMTLPRTITGFYRDKEVTGKFNVKEGREVALREGLTGPFMMAVAPFMVWLTGKGCKTASTNSKLIKALGDNFKEMLQKSVFTESVKADKNKFKQEFFKKTWEKVYKDSISGDKESDKTIDYINKEFNKYTSAKKRKERNTALNNIVEKVNQKLLDTSSQLDNTCKLSINIDGKLQTFNAEDMIKAINNYGTDAIERNKNFNNIDAAAAENITNNFAAKRLFFNIGTVATTLLGLSILPKIYAFSNISPGAEHLIKKKEEINANKNQQEQNNEVTFKGKGINSENVLSKLGKYIHNKVPAWVKSEFEYNGINFTPTLMACLSLFGLLTPRCIRAYNRAYIDENGKRDMSEINEILLRDTISSLAVVFTVPILQKLFVSTIESNKGFILTNRASDRFIDKINPYSKLKILSNNELQSIYGNIDSKDRMINFAKYIDSKGGDLSMVLAESKNAKDIFNDKTFTLESLKKDSRNVRNTKIISLFEKMENNSSTKELINKLMNDAGKGNQGTIAKVARGFNSMPGFISTVVISPLILGVLIPMLTYSNTRKTHEKMMQQASNSN